MPRGRFALALGVLCWSSILAAQTKAPAPSASSLRGIASLSVGRGLRFNNPFRLQRPLGESAESVSLSATYLDLGAALLVSENGFRQGVLVSGSVALQGIGQFVLTPSYMAQVDLQPTFGLRGRLGVPVVVAPDATLGLEAAVGPSFSVAYGLGVTAELVGSIFFGAATEENNVTTVPMLSLAFGMFFDHEVDL